MQWEGFVFVPAPTPQVQQSGRITSVPSGAPSSFEVRASAGTGVGELLADIVAALKWENKNSAIDDLLSCGMGCKGGYSRHAGRHCHQSHPPHSPTRTRCHQSSWVGGRGRLCLEGGECKCTVKLFAGLIAEGISSFKIILKSLTRPCPSAGITTAVLRPASGCPGCPYGIFSPVGGTIL